jgi:hypothetical protein
MGKARRKRGTLEGFPEINPNAAGIDVGNCAYKIF